MQAAICITDASGLLQQQQAANARADAAEKEAKAWQDTYTKLVISGDELMLKVDKEFTTMNKRAEAAESKLQHLVETGNLYSAQIDTERKRAERAEAQLAAMREAKVKNKQQWDNMFKNPSLKAKEECQHEFPKKEGCSVCVKCGDCRREALLSGAIIDLEAKLAALKLQAKYATVEACCLCKYRVYDLPARNEICDKCHVQKLLNMIREETT
jgi:multidrug efflux pump subunit AcrA (membrane-fusion protein)